MPNDESSNEEIKLIALTKAEWKRIATSLHFLCYKYEDDGDGKLRDKINDQLTINPTHYSIEFDAKVAYLSPEVLLKMAQSKCVHNWRVHAEWQGGRYCSICGAT